MSRAALPGRGGLPARGRGRACAPCRQLTRRPRPERRPRTPTIGHHPATQPSNCRGLAHGRAHGRAGHGPRPVRRRCSDPDRDPELRSPGPVVAQPGCATGRESCAATVRGTRCGCAVRTGSCGLSGARAPGGALRRCRSQPGRRVSAHRFAGSRRGARRVVAQRSVAALCVLAPVTAAMFAANPWSGLWSGRL